MKPLSFSGQYATFMVALEIPIVNFEGTEEEEVISIRSSSSSASPQVITGKSTPIPPV